MVRSVITVLALIAALGTLPADAQQAGRYKKFTKFGQPETGIDFYASSRQLTSPFEKPAADAVAKLKTLLGQNLPKGAIFVCSTLEQKDSIYEPQVLKMGYGWTLTATTADMRTQETLARIKSQMGGEIPAEILQRIRNQPPAMAADFEKQMVSSTVQQIAYAVLQSALGKNLQYRSSRLDDMGKSPLPDWLDIGIATYASGSNPNVGFLQQNMEQTFSIEDIISMSRPFVASTSGQGGSGGGGRSAGGPGGGGGGMMNPGGGQGLPPAGMGGARGSGGISGPGGQRGGSQRTLSKDEQDRMLFDAQAGTFFAFLREKVGIEKVRELIRQAIEGKESREFIMQPDVLGPDFGKIEESWAAWVKAQKPDRPAGPRPEAGANKTN